MARKTRQYGQTGIYHVMLRGVNKQRIFEWEEDYQAFLNILHKALTNPVPGYPNDGNNFDIYAYCLMDNHVHLLIGEKTLEISEIVKRLAGPYAQYYNAKYHRVGHFFQDRFKSYPVEDKEYFFTLLDYIHNNPVKGGRCKHPQDYPYSSFCELMGRPVNLPLCSYEPNLAYIDKAAIRDWVKSMCVEEQTRVVDRLVGYLSVLLNMEQEYDPIKAEHAIVDTLFSLTGVSSISEFQQLPKKPMREALAIVRDLGVSRRELSRLTGIPEGIIRYSKNPRNLIQ